MKYNFVAWIIYRMFEKSIFKYLKSEYGRQETKRLRKRTKQLYKETLLRTPSIGKGNTNTGGLVMGILFFSIFKATDGRMSEAVFAEMANRAGHGPMFIKMIALRDPFSEKSHTQKLSDAARSQASTYELDWCFTHEVVAENEYKTTYTKCGLCELAKKEGYFELAKHMCKIDYITIDIMGGKLERTKTIANGDEICNFHVTQKKNTAS